MTSPTLFVSSRAADRRAAALEWLAARPTLGETLVVGQTLAGPHDLILRSAGSRGTVLGLRRLTLGLLASELATDRLAETGRIEAGRAASEAIVQRALPDPERRSDLGRLERVADTPGFGRAVGAALEELRLAGIPAERLEEHDPDLAALARGTALEWKSAGLADRAATLEAAIETVRDADRGHAFAGHPILFYDLAPANRLEADLVAALAARAPASFATAPAGDAATIASGGRAGFVRTDAPDGEPAGALDRLQIHLFGGPPEVTHRPDESLTVFSAPGESRECVEIARRLLELAANGAGFDTAAILLRQPEDYRPYLEEALGRADIPAYFARGVRRPDPAGRALLSLLRCREEGYSAARFAEYLSVGEVPAATPDEEPPEAGPEEERWTPPDTVDDPAPQAARGPVAPRRHASSDEQETPTGEAVRAHTLRVPRRWEKLLVEASVVGGRDRWARRLAGLREQTRLKLSGLDTEDPDDPRRARYERRLADLSHLEAFALPLLDELERLPESATWSEWLDGLGALAARALRDPHNVYASLASLAPLGPVGPVPLAEVLRTLAPRLLEITEPPSGNRYGKVFVAPIDAARGLTFDVVFVPGMAERVFPPKIAEDPILLDRVRSALRPSDAGPGLETNAERVERERLALRLAVGAARERVVLSYPRIEAVKSRPRVPSFYMLEAVRAAEGTLPRFEDLAKRAEDVSEARIGWPAPGTAEHAIDEAEYDLAVLADLGIRGEAAVRAAGHLLHTNPHLARALRFRAYRWEVKRWTWADGLVDLSSGAAAALARHAPDARPFSATALQHFAACPYRFYLYAIQRLSPREEPVGIEALDPLERGSLVHQVQFELFTRLKRESQEAAARGEPPVLPVTPETLEHAHATLDDVLRKVSDDFADRLVPAIERVWRDGIESIRQDLREWLHRESIDPSPFEPHRFELSFGLAPDADRSEHSVPEPVDLGVGLSLRGAIDLVERTPAGVMRVTDHKTGRYRVKRNAVIQGGELLQPVLYGLAAQRLFPDEDVASGRLYYCTADGEFRDHEVELDPSTTGAAEILADVLGKAYEANAFHALPRDGACRWCDYRTICGPDEERRIRRKPAPVELRRLRELP